MTHHDTHRALLAMHDRAYRLLLDYLKREGFELPAQGLSGYQWLISAASTGNPQAQFFAAKMLSAGLFVDRDNNLAREWCVKAAQQQFAPAITMLGGFHETGLGGLVPNPAKAVELWRQATELEETGAMCALAGMYFDGRFFTKDRAAGFKLLRNAASAGNELAQCELGMLLVDDEDPALEAEGLRWFRAAAEKDLPAAHRHLAHYFRYGEHGLPVDPVSSHAHLQKAERIESTYL